MNYSKTNTYLGWIIFLIATAVYFITTEDTVSLWDCGEYITAAYKLEVGHPPGAPLFMVLGRIFSFFAAPENVAVWMNRLSGLCSSFTILFMFWSLTMLIRKMMNKAKDELSTGEKIAIFGSAVVGSMSYTFTESFWFSAVEGEVYAMASLFTAVVFWAILKWDDEMMAIQNGRLKPSFSPDRWLLAIMFMLGLAIGVHLLGILVVPAITFVIYFRYAKKINFVGILLVGLLSIVILGFIQEGVIAGSIAMASAFEITFRNSLGLPFFTGAIVFFILLIGTIIFLQRYARKKGNRILYSSLMGLALLFIGYGSFAVIVIRSNANPPLDENDPENLVTLHSYLKREQYGTAPLSSGQFWNSKLADQSEWGDNSPIMLRRFVVMKNGNDIKAFKDESRANAYAQKISGAEVTEKYYETNADTRQQQQRVYAQTTVFPRMYLTPGQPGAESKISRYKYWAGYDASEDKGTEIGSDGNRLPTMGENLRYFWEYQVNWMYWRYFMWNFAGRQNDIQGHGDIMRGNWMSGFSFIDNNRLGESGENAPYFTNENPSYNKFFLLPLIFGIIGLIFHYYKSPKDAFVLTLAFLFTGLAIVVYLNQKPIEPRERDYAYAGSFYFFAMWIGIGAYALFEAFRSLKIREIGKMGVLAGAITVVTLIFAAGGLLEFSSVITWLTIAIVGGGLTALMFFLGKGMKNNEKNGAILATVLGLIVPVLLGVQGWDDHDRSDKSSAHDLASNYLKSCGDKKNAIIFTNGDNDTFPLWYMQEVEGKFTDVRVCNLSLMQTDWYTDQMKMKAYESEPLPIKFTEDQIMMNAGKTDVVHFVDLFSLISTGGNAKIGKKIIDLRIKNNPEIAKNAMILLATRATPLIDKMSATRSAESRLLSKVRAISASMDTTDIARNLLRKYQGYSQLLSSIQNGGIKGEQNAMKQFVDIVQQSTKGWDRLELIDAMEFVRNDNNLFEGGRGGQKLRIFPTNAFKLKVNPENAVKSGVITEAEKKDCLKEINFDFGKSSYLTREQVMMLDIMANNDWKRGIYFSSPGGSDVSKAIYGRGHIKQNGLAFEISPLKSVGKIYNKEKMYDNLVNKYSYGQMNNPTVLTDYYARRHTNQYRMHFLALAKDYLSDAMRSRFPTDGQEDSKEVKEAKKKAINLLNKSLEAIPAHIVLDWSDPRGGQPYKFMGQNIPSYQDGILHEYVGTYLIAGDQKAGLKLGEEVERQLYSIINFYDKSNVGTVFGQSDNKDLFAALDGYLKLAADVTNPQFGASASPLAKRIEKRVNYIFDEMIPRVKKELRNLAIENGENVRRGARGGNYSGQLEHFDMYTSAIGEHFGLLEKTAPAPQPRQSAPALNPLNN